MLVKKEQEIWCERCTNGIYLFPELLIDKGLFIPCQTFYRQQDRYGRDLLFIKFPLNAFIDGDKLVQSDDHTTHLVWSHGKLVFNDSNNSTSLKVYTVKDFNNFHIIECYYNVISAKKGTAIKIRDEHEEVELVF